MHSYPKIYNLGHRYLNGIFTEPVLMEEKIDGSQFSFGKYLDSEGQHYLACRSKGAIIHMDAPEKMFTRAIETVRELEPLLTIGYTYRCEYLASPKHNVLAYDRVPAKHLIIFDITFNDDGQYLNYMDKEWEAKRVGLEVVPAIDLGIVESPEHFRKYLELTSILGGQKIEGIVVKNYARFGIDGKPLFGKFVSEAFKEVHASDWKERNPHGKDIIQILGDKYTTPARWQKAVQHLNEGGGLEGAPQDIGKLMVEVKRDTLEENAADIKDALFAWAWPQIQRSLTRGLPEWYKEQLLVKSFDA